MLIFCPNSIDWGNVAQWAGAISTFAAVFVALFKESLWQPMLKVRIILEHPDSFMDFWKVKSLTSQEIIETNCYMFRLWIWNKARSKRAIAEKVQVFANKLEKWEETQNTFFHVQKFLPMRLEWSYSREPYMDWISPRDMGKHCDLCHIINPVYRIDVGEDITGYPSHRAVLALNMEFKSSIKAHLLTEGKYRLYITIACMNAKPIQKIIEISFSGNWDDNPITMFQNNIRIKILDHREEVRN